MNRTTYFRLVMAQDAEWLRACLAQPTAFMRERHLALILLALRKKAGGR